jgi:ribosomal protein S11
MKKKIKLKDIRDYEEQNKLFKYRQLFYKKTNFFNSLVFKLKLRTVKSNFFITLTDIKNNVIMYRSTGQVTTEHSRRKKMSPYLIRKMINPFFTKM